MSRILLKGVSFFLIKRIFLFSAPLFIFLCIIELKIRKIPNAYKVKRDYFEKSIDSIELLVLGNSHMVHGVDPDYLSLKAFNLASGSQSYFYDNAITLNYLHRLKKLKAVIIPVDYFSFYYRLQDIADWLDFGYYKFWNIRYPGLSYWDSRNYFYFMLYTPANSFKYFLKSKNFSLAWGMKPNGFTPNNSKGSESNINEFTGKTRVQFHNHMIRFERQSESLSSLEELIRELSKNRIKVFLVESPVCSTYSKYCDTAILSKNFTIINNLVEKYNCSYKSYFTDKRFSISDFADNDHLNVEGARKFSTIIDVELLHSNLKK